MAFSLQSSSSKSGNFISAGIVLNFTSHGVRNVYPISLFAETLWKLVSSIDMVVASFEFDVNAGGLRFNRKFRKGNLVPEYGFIVFADESFDDSFVIALGDNSNFMDAYRIPFISDIDRYCATKKYRLRPRLPAKVMKEF